MPSNSSALVGQTLYTGNACPVLPPSQCVMDAHSLILLSVSPECPPTTAYGGLSKRLVGRMLSLVRLGDDAHQLSPVLKRCALGGFRLTSWYLLDFPTTSPMVFLRTRTSLFLVHFYAPSRECRSYVFHLLTARSSVVLRRERI